MDTTANRSCATSVSPKVLLVDEMSLGLAPLIVERLLGVLRDLAAGTGCGVLLVEQHDRQALSIADRGYVLENGRVVLEDTGTNLLTNPEVRKAYLGA